MADRFRWIVQLDPALEVDALLGMASLGVVTIQPLLNIDKLMGQDIWLVEVPEEMTPAKLSEVRGVIEIDSDVEHPLYALNAPLVPNPTEAEAREALWELGVYVPEAEGTLAQFPAVTEPPQPISVSQEDTTPAPQRTMNAVQPTGVFPFPSIPFLPSFPPCLLGIEPWCWLKSFKPPKIGFNLTPFKLTNVTYYVFINTRVTGTVVTRFGNTSEEGEEVEKHQKSGEERNRQKVEGSADLTGTVDHSMSLPDLANEVLAKIRGVFTGLTPGNLLDMEGAFEKRGVVKLLKSIVSQLLSGKIGTSNGIDVVMSYSFAGRPKTINRHLEIGMLLPVEGKVKYRWFT